MTPNDEKDPTRRALLSALTVLGRLVDRQSPGIMQERSRVIAAGWAALGETSLKGEPEGEK